MCQPTSPNDPRSEAARKDRELHAQVDEQLRRQRRNERR